MTYCHTVVEVFNKEAKDKKVGVDFTDFSTLFCLRDITLANSIKNVSEIIIKSSFEFKKGCDYERKYRCIL